MTLADPGRTTQIGADRAQHMAPTRHQLGPRRRGGSVVLPEYFVASEIAGLGPRRDSGGSAVRS
jgi:hypothetical protein